MSFSTYSPQRLIAEAVDCSCGRTHRADGLKQIHVGRGVLPRVIAVLRDLGIEKPFLLTDRNEYRAAGERVEALLREAGIAYTIHIIPYAEGKHIPPDEFAVGSATLNFDVSCDGILCVGSGVMNDIAKILSAVSGRPSVVVATAPSMDGYASDTSAMEVNHVKSSLKEVSPTALICDIDIMAQAPMRMLWAGLGDMLGKFSALREWKLASMLNDEHYCAETDALVRNSLEKIVSGAEGIPSRDPDSVEQVTNGLLLSGIAMAYTGQSRPASGLDHYFSHCWEMMALERGEESDLHGIQVGVGVLLTLRIYEHLRELHPTMEGVHAALASFDPAAWEANLRRVLGSIADDMVEMERTAQKNDPTGRLRRAQKAIENWDRVLYVAEHDAPTADELEALMKRIGMPTRPSEIGISEQDVIDAFVCSRDVRNKFQLSSMIWDIGCMDEVAEWLRGIL